MPQTVIREVDIPNVHEEGKNVVKLAPAVGQEAIVRKYIRKDGVFRKDLKSLFFNQVDKGKPAPEMVYTHTTEQANREAIKECELSGRKISLENGRYKATPGWNLDIHVPGHESSEKVGVKEPEGADRQKLADRAVLTLQDQVKDLTAKLEGVEPKSVKGVAGMTIFELKAYAKDNEISLGDATRKKDILGLINQDLRDQAEDES